MQLCRLEKCLEGCVGVSDNCTHCLSALETSEVLPSRRERRERRVTNHIMPLQQICTSGNARQTFFYIFTILHLHAFKTIFFRVKSICEFMLNSANDTDIGQKERAFFRAQNRNAFSGVKFT